MVLSPQASTACDEGGDLGSGCTVTVTGSNGGSGSGFLGTGGGGAGGKPPLTPSRAERPDPVEVAVLAEVNTCTSVYASPESRNTTSRSTDEDRSIAAAQILTATVPSNSAFGKKFRVTFADGGSEEYKKVASSIQFVPVSGSLKLGKEGQTCSGQG